MSRRTHDWEALARAWLTDKRQTPALSQREFFRSRGIDPSVGNRKIGARMKADWEAVQAQARQHAIEAVGNDLGAEAGRFIRLGKTAVQIGARNIFPKLATDGSEIPPPHQPSNFSESLALMKEGRTLTEVGITLLTGGEPLKSETPEDIVIDFIPPAAPVSAEPADPAPAEPLPGQKPDAEAEGGRKEP